MDTSRFKTAMICSASCDSMGWIKEFYRKIPEHLKDVHIDKFYTWDKYVGGFYWKHKEQMLEGEYSDDTQLMICTLRSLRTTDWRNSLGYYELPLWLLYQRGGGSASKRQAETLTKRKYPWEIAHNDKYYSAGGNGGVMRILPHLFKDYMDIAVLVKNATLNGLLTHGSPVAIIGTIYYSTMLFLVYHGYSRRIILEYLTSEEYYHYVDSTLSQDYMTDFVEGYTGDFSIYQNAWNRTMEKIHSFATFIKGDYESGHQVDEDEVLQYLGATTDTQGSALACAMASLYLYCKYEDMMQGVGVPINNTYTDTDTLGSMLGALYGLDLTLEELPSFFMDVQDREYFCNLIDMLYTDPIPTSNEPLNTKKLKEKIFKATKPQILESVPNIGTLELQGIRQLPCPLDNKRVLQSLLTLGGGQKIYIKKFEYK